MGSSTPLIILAVICFIIVGFIFIVRRSNATVTKSVTYATRPPMVTTAHVMAPPQAVFVQPAPSPVYVQAQPAYAAAPSPVYSQGPPVYQQPSSPSYY